MPQLPETMDDASPPASSTVSTCVGDAGDVAAEVLGVRGAARWLRQIVSPCDSIKGGGGRLIHSPDASLDAGRDAGVDAGRDAGGDAGPPCAFETHTLAAAGQRPIDVLFVVDNSGSMADDQAALARNAQSFFRAFLGNQLDFHLGVTVTDTTVRESRGHVSAPFITAQTPNVQAVFQEMVQVGSDGSGDEKALLAAFSALHEPMLTTGNAGFIRAAADLAIVFLGDEDDHSLTLIGPFASDVKKLKGPDSDITVAAILGLVPPPGCDVSQIEAWRIASFAGVRQ